MVKAASVLLLSFLPLETIMTKKIFLGSQYSSDPVYGWAEINQMLPVVVY